MVAPKTCPWVAEILHNRQYSTFLLKLCKIPSRSFSSPANSFVSSLLREVRTGVRGFWGKGLGLTGDIFPVWVYLVGSLNAPQACEPQCFFDRKFVARLFETVLCF